MRCSGALGGLSAPARRAAPRWRSPAASRVRRRRTRPRSRRWPRRAPPRRRSRTAGAAPSARGRRSPPPRGRCAGAPRRSTKSIARPGGRPCPTSARRAARRSATSTTSSSRASLGQSRLDEDQPRPSRRSAPRIGARGPRARAASCRLARPVSAVARLVELARDGDQTGVAALGQHDAHLLDRRRRRPRAASRAARSPCRATSGGRSRAPTAPAGRARAPRSASVCGSPSSKSSTSASQRPTSRVAARSTRPTSSSTSAAVASLLIPQ